MNAAHALLHDPLNLAALRKAWCTFLFLHRAGIELPDPASLANMSDAERSALIKRLKKVQKQQEQERKVSLI